MATIAIPLTQGKIALIDEEDIPRISQYSWHVQKRQHTFYAFADVPERGRKNRRRLRMHRFILDAPAGFEVHHINGDGLDNRRANLCLMTSHDHRTVTSRARGHQPRHEREKKSARVKPRGISQEKRSGKWRAAILINVGTFADADSARRAREEKIKALNLDRHGIR